MTPSASLGIASTTRSRVAIGALSAVIGLVLFLAAGFAAPGVLHNSTHDTRHALGLPCH
jgi:cobalt transporter subunit CbtB